MDAAIREAGDIRQVQDTAIATHAVSSCTALQS